MATNLDPTQQAPAQPATPLWPAPVFVLGVGALVAVCLCRPLFHGPASSDALLSKARKELDRPDGDARRAIDLARRALDHGTKRRGEADYVLGAAHLRLADRAEPAAAEPLWQKAREYLEQAETEGVKEEDAPALSFQLARVDFHDDRNLTGVIERLEACAEQIEARAEAYDLLTRAYLRLSPPNLDKALDANRLLREAPSLNGPELAAAQLTGAELLLRAGKPGDARTDLELLLRQPGGAQLAVRVRASLLLARCHQDEKNPDYDQAVKLYRAALKEGRANVPNLAQVYYNLGLSLAQLKKNQEAADAWKECMNLAQGKEAQAVGIVYAELCLLNNAPPETVIEALKKAVNDVNSPADWKNPLVGLDRARQVFETALETFHQAKRYDSCLQTIEPYARLAETRRALELRGKLCAEWGRVRREPATITNPTAPPPDAAWERQTMELFRLAAQAYGEAAKLPGLKPNEVADYLWLAVPCHLTVGDLKERDAARLKLKKLVEPALGLEPARLGETWYLLGEEYRAAEQPKEAETAYQECLKYVTRYAYLARYQLAKAALLRGEIDAARDALKQNLSQLTWDSDAEAMSQTLFELCGLLYRRGAYREVVRYYEEALGRYAGKFKDRTELTRARYQLADSYRQIAAQENMAVIIGSTSYSPETRAHLEKMHREWLTKAAEEFAGLDTFLETSEGQNCLSIEQRNQVPFITAKCWYNLGLYEKSLVVYERLIRKHEGKVEGLEALGGAVSCHAAMGQVGKVQQRLIQIDRALKDMPAEIREPWAKWLEEARKGLKDV
jgi:tetratricopeptide (TPR) repeat protein